MRLYNNGDAFFLDNSNEYGIKKDNKVIFIVSRKKNDRGYFYRCEIHGLNQTDKDIYFSHKELKKRIDLGEAKRIYIDDINAFIAKKILLGEM